jgi:Mrp family chromosome partitioning ATPase
MTATDRAFIRVFDQDADRAELAPHVLFAARGVQMSKTIAIADALAEQRQGGSRGARRSLAPVDARQDAAAIDAARPTAPPRPPQKQDRRSRSTYLPSAYRNLVGIDDSHAVSEGPRIVAFEEPGASDDRADANGPRTLDRSPVSDAVSAAPASYEFRPALEVDALRWPPVVDLLLDRHAQQLAILGDALQRCMGNEQRVIVFQSTSRGAGCTTIALALARLLVGEGNSVAIVDAAFRQPGLAAATGLVIDEGWERSLVTPAPIAESVIQSLQDAVAIVPLGTPRDHTLGGAASPDRVAAALRELGKNFDAVLVDTGCTAEWFTSASARTSPLAVAADACVVVYRFDPHSRADAYPQVDLPLPLVGVVENLAFTGAA